MSPRLLAGDGRNFHLLRQSFRSPQHGGRRERRRKEVAINRPTKRAFRQGSEVWITVCPKFGTTAKSGLTTRSLEVGDAAPELGDGTRVPAFFAGVDRRRCLSESVIGWDSTACCRPSPFGLIVFFLLGFVRRRGQRGEVCGRTRAGAER